MTAPESAQEVAVDPIGSPRASRSRLRRAFGFALDATLLIALAFTVFIAYGLVGNRWYHILAIEGGSMEPTITRGDLIVVTPLESEIRPGMILTMGVNGRIVTHRVIAVLPDGSLVTRGDANGLDDDWQGKPITVFGQYAFTIPALGRFLPISNGSAASFTDQETAAQRIEVGHWTISGPDPAVALPPAATPALTPEPTAGEPTAADATPAEPTPSQMESASPPVTDPPLPTYPDTPSASPDPEPTP
jgi:signal peptidase I